MTLIPDDLRARLIANGAAKTEADQVPVMKLFVGGDVATWLLTELLPDGDTLFGLWTWDSGRPNSAMSASATEKRQASLRPSHRTRPAFPGAVPVSVYAEAARRAGAITEAEACCGRRLSRWTASAMPSVRRSTADDPRHPRDPAPPRHRA